MIKGFIRLIVAWVVLTQMAYGQQKKMTISGNITDAKNG
jgi:hypothetical protein